jgi:hypothetical protein
MRWTVRALSLLSPLPPSCVQLGHDFDDADPVQTARRYYTVSRLAPPDWVPVVGWFDGWMNLLGQVAGVA